MVYPKLINRKSLCFQTLVSLATTVPENDVVYMMRLPKNSTPDAWVPSQSSGCPAWIAAWQWGGGPICDFSIQRPWPFFFFLNFLSPPHPPFWPHLRGCGILVPNQELNPCPLQWKCEVFTGLLGKSQSHELLRNGSFLVDSVQLSHSVVSNSLWPHEQQHARPPYPSPTAGVYPNPCSLCWWCHPTISSSVVPFSSCPQSFPASGSFQMSQLFASGGQSTGVSASTSVLPMNTQDWSPLEWTGWISWQSKGLSRVFSNTIVQKHQVFGPQLSSQSNSHIHTWPLEKP